MEEFSLSPERVFVIHNGIRIPNRIPRATEFDPPQAEDTPARPFHIGTVGRLVPVKDYALFLSTAAALKQHLVNVRFSILGDGPNRNELAQKVVDLGLSGSVQLLSPVSDPFPYYRTLDLYLNTSRHEGIPLSILEAMACEVPVVAAKVGGIPEIISDTVDGFLIRDRKEDAFAITCLRLLRDTTLRKSVGQLSRKKIEGHFSAEIMAAHYLTFYTHHSQS
jgi:glycosyltransferase involved in cell wall biosynthesis